MFNSTANSTWPPNPRAPQISDFGQFVNLVSNDPGIQQMAGQNNAATQVLNFLNGGSFKLGDHTGEVDVGIGTIGINPTNSAVSGHVNLRNPNLPSATLTHKPTGISIKGTGGIDPTIYGSIHFGDKQSFSPLDINTRVVSTVDQGLGIPLEANEVIQSEAVKREIEALMPNVRSVWQSTKPNYEKSNGQVNPSVDNVSGSYLNPVMYR